MGTEGVLIENFLTESLFFPVENANSLKAQHFVEA